MILLSGVEMAYHSRSTGRGKHLIYITIEFQRTLDSEVPFQRKSSVYFLFTTQIGTPGLISDQMLPPVIQSNGYSLRLNN